MPIFISYSHDDAAFVEDLAKRLVKAKHHIWIDRWELKVGDSLTARVQESLTEASAILFILSKKSVESDWCKRELTAGLVREIEERQTIVLPCVIEDCEIPLFLRDKLYADFRTKPEEAFVLLDKSLSSISNATTSRTISSDFNTDFTVEWKTAEHEQTEETWIVRWTFVDHGEKLPYVVISEFRIFVADGMHEFEAALKHDTALRFIKRLMGIVVKNEKSKKTPLSGLIDGNLTQFIIWQLKPSNAEHYVFHYSYRRLGIDNGMSTHVYLDNNLLMALEHLEKTVPE